MCVKYFSAGTAVGQCGGAIFKLTGDLLNIAAAAGFSRHKKFIRTAGQIHVEQNAILCKQHYSSAFSLCSSAGVKNTQ